MLLLPLLIAACCSTERSAGAEPASPGGGEAAPPPTHEVTTEPHAPSGVGAPPEGSDAPEPLPATFDCQAPPPLQACCRALLPKCTQCADRNEAIAEAYRAQCGVP
jgi:hypothetical protein